MAQFDAYRAGVAELAWIVEDDALREALWRALEARDRLEYFAPAQCEALEFSPEGATLRLRDDRTLRARLVVGADGHALLLSDDGDDRHGGVGHRERPLQQVGARGGPAGGG